MTSIRWTVISWIVAVLGVVGVASGGIAYVSGKHEAIFFLDGQLAQVAQHAGDEMIKAHAAFPTIDPEDELVLQIWDADGNLVKATGRVALPLQPGDGFVDIAFDAKLTLDQFVKAKKKDPAPSGGE